MTARVVVVGGGVMGSAAAWQLAARGAEVTLVEQFGPTHTRGASHGSSRIFRHGYLQPDYVELAARALAWWRRLEAETGAVVLTLTGAVDHGPESTTSALHDSLVDAGLAPRDLTPAAAASRWPWLRFDTSVLFHAEAGRIHAEDAVRALHQAAAVHGARLVTGDRVLTIEPGTTSVTVRLGSGRSIEADAVVVAAGAWTESLLGDVVSGLPPLRTTQEQPVHFPSTVPADEWPSFLHHGGAALAADGGIYGLGSVDGVKVGEHGVGAVIDPEVRERTVDAALERAVVDYVREWLPGADPAQPQVTTCLYTSTPNSDFVVDRQGPVTVLAGFSGHGFKFAPAIGALAAELTLDGAAPVPRFRLGVRSGRDLRTKEPA